MRPPLAPPTVACALLALAWRAELTAREQWRPRVPLILDRSINAQRLLSSLHTPASTVRQGRRAEEGTCEEQSESGQQTEPLTHSFWMHTVNSHCSLLPSRSRSFALLLSPPPTYTQMAGLSGMAMMKVMKEVRSLVESPPEGIKASTRGTLARRQSLQRSAEQGRTHAQVPSDRKQTNKRDASRRVQTCSEVACESMPARAV
jgi:hypothetical protein